MTQCKEANPMIMIQYGIRECSPGWYLPNFEDSPNQWYYALAKHYPRYSAYSVESSNSIPTNMLKVKFDDSE